MKPRYRRCPDAPPGFTLVEIMIVVVIIGLLAAIAIPAFKRVQERARVSAFANDLRIGCNAFEQYALENGGWPPDGISAVPAVMANRLNLSKYSQPTALGGAWDWDLGQFYYTAGLAVVGPTASNALFVLVDREIDDGNLSTGNFRSRTGGYVFILEP